MNHIESPATGDGAIEREIQARGANVAPRVTPDDLKANIVSEHYFTAIDGVVGAAGCPSIVAGTPTSSPLDLLTFCVLVLRNGFTVTGESACASPENFNADIGRKIARENAVAKCWPLLGYALKERLAAVPASHLDRVRLEQRELNERLGKLEAFIDSARFTELPDDERARMIDQSRAMRSYSTILSQRLAAVTA